VKRNTIIPTGGEKRLVADKFKKNKGNQIAKKGEEFVEETLKVNTFHPAQNSPAKPHNR
jgi:hypothetical protein